MNSREKRRRRRQFKGSSKAELALAWYDREAWNRLREVADDAQALDDTYEDWESGALEAIRNFESLGQRPVKVPIDIDALLAWCREHGKRIDSAARAEYVTHLRQSKAKSG